MKELRARLDMPSTKKKSGKTRQSPAARFLALTKQALQDLRTSNGAKTVAAARAAKQREQAKLRGADDRQQLAQFLRELSAPIKNAKVTIRSDAVRLEVPDAARHSHVYDFPSTAQPAKGELGFRGLRGEKFATFQQARSRLEKTFMPHLANKYAEILAAKEAREEKQRAKSLARKIEKTRRQIEIENRERAIAEKRFGFKQTASGKPRCPSCGGKGLVGAFHCPHCGGSGSRCD